MTAGGPNAGARPILVVGPPGADTGTLGRFLGDLGLAVTGGGADPTTDPVGDLESRFAATGAPVVVLAWRAPAVTVAALAAEGVAPAHAAAVWEATLVHGIRGASGLPLVGLDLDQPATALPRLAESLTRLGIAVPAGTADGWVAAWPAPTPDADAATTDPETAALIAAIGTRLAPVLAAAADAHESWSAPADLVVGPTSAALLAAQLAAHRSAADAAAAWAATHEAETAARDAKAAVEREHRELVGPDPLHYRELRRELWRVRDEFAGIVAGRTNYHVAWMRADAERLTAEQQVLDLHGRLRQMELDQAPLHEARAQRDAMLASRRWWLGGLVTRPLARLRGRTPPR